MHKGVLLPVVGASQQGDLSIRASGQASSAPCRMTRQVNPDAHKLYSNRAACYTKLGAWNDGLKDADECIRLAPEFSKGYRWEACAKPN